MFGDDSAFMRILANPWTLAVVMTLGPALLWWLSRRSKAPSGGAKKPRPTAAAAKEKSQARSVVPGFRDVRWGEPPLPEMTVVHEMGDEKLYSRRADELIVDGAAVNSIMYSYHRDRLLAVMIEMPLGSGDRVLRGRSAEWGQPRQPNAGQARFFWLDLLGGMDATQAVLDRNAQTAKSSLIISSKYIKEQRDKEKAAASDR